MKKTFVLKLICFSLLAAVLFVVFSSCGDAPKEVGTYKGVYYKFVGDSEEAKVTDEEFSLILKPGGKGTSIRDGEEYDMTWTLDGENFTMKETFLILSIDYTGTLKDGVIDIFNGDPTDDLTVEYVYEISK